MVPFSILRLRALAKSLLWRLSRKGVNRREGWVPASPQVLLSLIWDDVGTWETLQTLIVCVCYQSHIISDAVKIQRGLPRTWRFGSWVRGQWRVNTREIGKYTGHHHFLDYPSLVSGSISPFHLGNAVVSRAFVIAVTFSWQIRLQTMNLVFNGGTNTKTYFMFPKLRTPLQRSTSRAFGPCCKLSVWT